MFQLWTRRDLLTRLRWLLELNTCVSAFIVYVATHIAKSARDSASDHSDSDDDDLYAVISQGSGDAAFLIMLGVVTVGAFTHKFGQGRWSGATMRHVRCFLEIARFLSVFPFALAALLVLVVCDDGYVQAVGIGSLTWVLLLLGQLLLTPLLEHMHAGQSSEVAEAPASSQLLSEGRQVVPGDAKVQLLQAQTLAPARPLALPRQCSLCYNALPNTRCQPCGHSVACEPCLLHWARGAPAPCCCPVCDRVLEGYEVTAEVGAYFWELRAEEAGGAGIDQMTS